MHTIPPFKHTHTLKISKGENESGIVPYNEATIPLTSISSLEQSQDLILSKQRPYILQREMMVVRYVTCWKMTVAVGHKGAHRSPTTGEVEAREP